MKLRFSAGRRCRAGQRFGPLLVPAAAVLCAALVSLCWVTAAWIPSGSMEPTLPSGSLALCLRGAYASDPPQCGDIVLFEKPDVTDTLLVKRVIALPGQCFEVRAGRVYLDGVLLEEPYVREFSMEDCPPVLVPEGCYILLGDARGVSQDSRFWQDPFVRREQIRAKAVWLLFPAFRPL